MYPFCSSFLLLPKEIDSAFVVLKEVLKPVVDREKEIPWPPIDPEAVILTKKGKEDGGKELEAMSQKVLQIYASAVLSNQSYAKKVSIKIIEIRKECEELTNLIPQLEEDIPKLQKFFLDEEKVLEEIKENSKETVETEMFRGELAK
ncbi:unnamed protein product, partial [Ilex paraguariensis]